MLDHGGAGVADRVERDRFAGDRGPVSGVTQQRRGTTQPDDDGDVEGEDDDERNDRVGGQLDVLERAEHELRRQLARLAHRRPYYRAVIVRHCKQPLVIISA